MTESWDGQNRGDRPDGPENSDDSTVLTHGGLEGRSPDPASVQTIFNRITPVYDSLNDWLSLGLHRVWKQMAVSWSDPQPGDTCLDVCCGSGDLTRLLARRVGPDGTVIGVDFASDLLQKAEDINRNSPFPLPITWIEGDALALPLADNTFDAATMGYGLRNVASIEQSLRELLRVLKPGARVAILDFHQPDNPLMQQFQRFYLDSIVVPLARQFGVESEYAYIAPSVERFPRGGQQTRLAQQVGFSKAVHYAILGGMMGVLVAQKPPA